MAGYEIGMSGIHAAQNALNIIGNNLANAATEGYHKQEIDLRPARDSYMNGVMVGQGVEFGGLKRQIDNFLESEILRYNSLLSATSREMEAMRIVESGMGELTTTSISESLDNFYSSLYDLSNHPEEVNYRTSVLATAETLSNQFRNLANVVHDLQDSLYAEALGTVEKINEMGEQIAQMNQEIFTLQVRGRECSNMLDQRDLLVSQLGEMIGVRVIERDHGVVDISVSDIPLVIGSNVSPLQVGMVNDGNSLDVGIAAADSEVYRTSMQGGSLSGVLELRNNKLQDFLTKLDTLAVTVISETNKLHVQGIGSESFTSLTGWTMTETNVTDFVPPVTGGTIYVRVIDPSGVVTRHAVTVDSSSTMASVAVDLAAIPGLDIATGLYSGRLQIVANTGYQFDFLPGVLSTPTSTVPSPLAGAGAGADQLPPLIEISGQYTGSTNQTYTCTVHTSPPGQTLAIGNGTMELEVTDGSGSTVATVMLGSEYGEGTTLELDEGIKIRFRTNGISAGYLNDGDVITVEALANSDTSGFLAAVGINCFFSGQDAGSIDVVDNIRQNVSRIAASTSADGTGNLNCLAIARLGERAMTELNGLTTKEFYRQMAVDVGHDLSVLEMQYNNTDGIVRNLQQHRDEISSVDVNEEASRMIIFERVFQAMAKYMSTVNSSLDIIITILS